MATILLEGMEFFAYHGHFKEERIIGSRFTVDLEFDYDSGNAEKSDRLHDAVNYQEIYLLVNKEMGITSHLLENVAQRILDALKSNYPGITSARLKVAKQNPQLGSKVKQVSCVLSY